VGRDVEHGGLYAEAEGSVGLYRDEGRVLQRFKRDGYPFVQRVLTDWEALTLGQHHKLPTRLLDWTSNPLVALFFAAEPEAQRDCDGAVFAYRRRIDSQHHISMFRGENPQKPRPPNPLEVNGIKMVFPMLLADRLIAQSGGFTIQDPLKCLMKRDSEDFAEADLDVLEIYRWTLRKKDKFEVLNELHRVSVNRRTLFPGLDGVGEVQRTQERFRKVK
jgi:hypothetical protein